MPNRYMSDSEVPVTRLVWKGGRHVPMEELNDDRHLYVGGPVPVDWLGEAARLPGKRALTLAIALYCLRKLYKRTTGLIMPDWLLEKFVISRRTYWRGLNTLEQAGLVSVERRRGSKARVSLQLEMGKPAREDRLK